MSSSSWLMKVAGEEDDEAGVAGAREDEAGAAGAREDDGAASLSAMSATRRVGVVRWWCWYRRKVIPAGKIIIFVIYLIR